MPFAAIRARVKVEDLALTLQRCVEVAAKHQTFLQVVDPLIVYSERHLEAAWQHAERAQREGRMTAKTLEAEFLMYLTGQRQVSVALPMAGIRTGLASVIVCAGGDRAGAAVWGLLDRMGWSRDPAGIGTNPEALQRLGVVLTNADPEDAVLEMVALVDLAK